MATIIVIPGKPQRWMRPGQDGTARFTDKQVVAASKAIKWEARRAYGLRRPCLGPLVVRVIAVFAIPPSWPEKLKAAARDGRVMHVADPDLDQIVKLVKDALKGVAYVDDNQVCGYPNSAKRYGYPERTEITIEELPQAEDEITPGQRRLMKRVATEGWDKVLAPPPKRRNPSKAESDGGPKWPGERPRGRARPFFARGRRSRPQGAG